MAKTTGIGARLLPDDLDDLFALYRVPEIRRFFPEGTLTYEETRDELEFFLNGHPDHPEPGLWATVCRETHEFIGPNELFPRESDPAAHLVRVYRSAGSSCIANTRLSTSAYTMTA